MNETLGPSINSAVGKLLQSWLHVWLYAVATVGLVVAVVLAVRWNDLSYASRVVHLLVIGLSLHVWEEWRIPGGFHHLYNLVHDSGALDRYPMNQLSDMITNVGGLTVGIVVAFLAGDHPATVVAMIIFCGVQAIAHTFGGIRGWLAYRSSGKRTIYNPGFATTYVLFVPLGATLVYGIAAGSVDVPASSWVTGALWFVPVALALTKLPEQFLKSTNSPYQFESDRYFDQFVA